ncbi:MAG: hypothetical protein II458_01770 [Oscillospiraceae bacterium]|nr:hypothetical protein [Oscillospiraceae bacterium]
MKKLSIGRIIGLALLAGLVPYHFKKDEETGGFEAGGLLWSVKKTPGEEKDNYIINILPAVNFGEKLGQ